MSSEFVAVDDRYRSKENTPYSILGTNAFFQDQINAVDEAKFRAWIQTMAFEPSHFTNLLVY
ncbi:MAG: hypothetical protein ABFQ62_03225 [Patescibacteria group bacterium]